MAAAAIAVWLIEPLAADPDSTAPDLDVRAGAAVATRRPALIAAVARPLTVRAAGADALWIYRDDGVLIEGCPGARACRATAAGLELTVRLAARRHRALAVAGVPDLHPSGDFDADVLAARARAARLELRPIVVTPGGER